jgi:RND family efflux transporter MFP subunit
MGRNYKLLLPAVIILAGLIVAWLLLLTSPKAKRESTASQPPLVKFIEVQPRDVRIPVFTQGTVKPRTSINLSAEVTGRIVEVSPAFSNGSFFKKDDVLLRINPSDYQLAITKAEALVASAKQQLARAEAEYRQKVQEYKGITRAKVSDYALRKPQYEEAKAKLKSAGADLDLAKVQLARCNIKAPFDGRVVSKKSDVGQYVMPGMVMAEVYSTDVAEVRLPLSPGQINLLDLPISNGIPSGERLVKVKLSGKAAGQLQTWSSELVRTEAVIDERNRLQYVVAQVKDPYLLKPDANAGPVLDTGLFVEAEIEGRLLTNVVVLPRLAIHNNNTVWVLNTKNRLNIRRVNLLHRGEYEAYVKQEETQGIKIPSQKYDGISSGDRVITSPLDAVVEGMQLRIESPIMVPEFNVPAPLAPAPGGN